MVAVTLKKKFAAVHQWLRFYGVPVPGDGAALERLHREAVKFALQRGSRSGRIAWQFSRAQAGARALDGGKGKGRNKSTK